MTSGVWGKIFGRTGIAATIVAACFQGAAAQPLPTGFSATRLFSTTTLSAPTSLAFTPDGRMLITLQGGDLRVAQNGDVVATPGLALGTKLCSTSERGLLGVAVDPQFSGNSFIYLYYTFRKFPNAEPTATDMQGATASVAQNMMPRKVGLTFNTSPAGLGVRVHGQPINGGQVVTSWEGWGLAVQAPPQVFAMQNYYFANWSDPGASTHFITTPAAAAAYTAAFSTIAPASADADANGQYDALTDGLLILRHMFGLSDATLIDGAIGPNALHTTPGAVTSFLNSAGLALDIDDDGTVDALTDGLLILRYLSGMRGQPLIEGVVANGALRAGAQDIENYTASLLP